MSTSTTCALLLLVVLLLAPVLAIAARRRRLDVFEPHVIFAIYLLLGYVSPIPSLLEGSDTFSVLYEKPYWCSDSLLFRTLLVVSLGVVGFYLGYFLVGRLTWRKPRVTTGLHWRRRRMVVLGAVYTAVGLGMLFTGIGLIGGIGVVLSGLADRIRLFEGLNYFFQATFLLMSFCLVWWCYLLVRKRSLLDRPFWLYVLFTLAVVSAQGSKSIIFVFTFCGALMYHIVRRRIAASIAIGAATAVFVLLTFYALVTREYLVIGRFSTLDVESRSVAAWMGPVKTEFGGNFFQLQLLARIIEATPKELPYQHGKTYLSLATLPVPRGLWPDKLVPSTGTLTMALWPRMWLELGTTLPPGLMGEMYMNFGALGVAFGMLTFGFVLARARVRVAETGQHPVAVTVYALLVAMMPHYLRGEFVAPTAMLAMIGVPAWLALRLVVSPREQPSGLLFLRDGGNVGSDPPVLVLP